jgi:endonuclease/exonuclease/phosphatase family metal-dependent hydrolase
MMKRTLIFLVITALLAGIDFLGLTMLTNFRPDDIEAPEFVVTGSTIDSMPDTLSFVTWNLGYGGLGREMDFFFDGGKFTRPDEIVYRKYWSGITDQLATFHHFDFIMLQEVDFHSRRSYFDDQWQELLDLFPGHSATGVVNYDVMFVPAPLLNPMGRVLSGMALMSRAQPVSSERVALESEYSWPQTLFMPDRCFIINRYALNGERELVVINTHNSAFDSGELRKTQMERLKAVMLDEYEKGNYVVAGGDWNLNPPLFRYYKINTGDLGIEIEPEFDQDFFPDGWYWAFYRYTPTNRSLVEPYLRSRTNTTVIDFFIISPNIRYTWLNTLDLGFENSDHHPVVMKVVLDRLEKTSTSEQP